MSFLYDGVFRVVFSIDTESYDTHSTWGLVPLDKPLVTPPMITADGVLKAGTNSWRFALSDTRETFEEYLDIAEKLNGKRAGVRIYYSYDTTKYKDYSGRVTVEDFSTDSNYSVITIGCVLYSDEDIAKRETLFAGKYALQFVRPDDPESVWNTYNWGEQGWKLIPEKKPVVESPKPRTNYVTTPGANGALDLSEILSGGHGVFYDNAEGEWSFRIADEYYEQADDIFHSVASVLNGKVATVTTLNGTGESYTGRFSVSGIDVGSDAATFKIGYVIDPYAVETRPVMPKGGDTGFVSQGESYRGTYNTRIPDGYTGIYYFLQNVRSSSIDIKFYKNGVYVKTRTIPPNVTNKYVIHGPFRLEGILYTENDTVTGQIYPTLPVFVKGEPGDVIGIDLKDHTSSFDRTTGYESRIYAYENHPGWFMLRCVPAKVEDFFFYEPGVYNVASGTNTSSRWTINKVTVTDDMVISGKCAFNFMPCMTYSSLREDLYGWKPVKVIIYPKNEQSESDENWFVYNGKEYYASISDTSNWGDSHMSRDIEQEDRHFTKVADTFVTLNGTRNAYADYLVYNNQFLDFINNDLEVEF